MHVPERLEQGGSLHGDFHRIFPILERLSDVVRQAARVRPTDSKIRGETGRPARRSASRGTDSAKARPDAQERGEASPTVLGEILPPRAGDRPRLTGP
jgi:hypothetical protein